MNNFVIKLTLTLVSAAICIFPASHAGNALAQISAMEYSSLLLLDANRRPVLSHQPGREFIPASTVKLITALMALERWGRGHRFKTEFYLDHATNVLIIRGLGDPFLISEELDLIVNKLRGLNISQLKGLSTNSDYFSPTVNSSKYAQSNNPYDAAMSALAVNFNTINVNVKSGVVTSAEAQTPITPMARKLGSALSNGRHRINLGLTHAGPEYFSQVLAEKIRRAGIQIESVQGVNGRQAPNGTHTSLLFVHSNSHTLEHVVKAMLEYSNNFIANQLFLLLGADQFGEPASREKSRRMVQQFIARQFQWQGYTLEEGAGLSRSNKLNAYQLTELLEQFARYRDLMPQQQPGILAKSGTMAGISSYAGYLHRYGEWQPFALLVNQPVPYQFREQLAEELLHYHQ